MDIIELMRRRAGHYSCPICGKGLENCGLELLRETGHSYTVRVTCASCAVSFIVVLALQGDEQPEALEAEATVAAQADPEPIELDELLDVHQILSDHRGDLVSLLNGGHSPGAT